MKRRHFLGSLVAGVYLACGVSFHKPKIQRSEINPDWVSVDEHLVTFFCTKAAFEKLPRGPLPKRTWKNERRKR